MLTLEHFYYGKLIHRNVPAGNPRVLAKSDALTDTQIQSALQNACLTTDETLEGGAWAVVRGDKTVPFILVHAQMMAAGCVYRHFVLLPPALLRELQGNLKVLEQILDDEMPVYQMLGDAQDAIHFEIPATPPVDDQVDELLEMMSFAGNNMGKLESLLAAMVNGTTLMIVNAPPVRQERTEVVQGLLTLLPASTRFSMMFATTDDGHNTFNAGILFVEEIPDDDSALIYDAKSRTISGEKGKNDYARFIISQLRLDVELAIQQTEALTPTAGWRFKNGYKLAEALSYASHRSKLDNALTNNMPVEGAEVAKILAEDPTLTPVLRRTYAHHLLNFSLALEDMQHMHAIAMSIKAHPDLEQGIHDTMQNAINDGKGYLIFETLLRWYQSGLASDNPMWLDLLHQSMLQELDELVSDHDVEGVNDWMDDMQSLNPIHYKKITADISTHLMPIAADSEELAGKILLLAMSTMSADEVEMLLKQHTFTKGLSPLIRQYLRSVQLKASEPSAGVMLRAAESMGQPGQSLALALFAEMAAKQDYFAVFDIETLAALVDFIQTDTGTAYRGMLAKVASAFPDEHLKKLRHHGGRSVLQLLLAGNYHRALLRQMTTQSRDLYGTEHQERYFRVIFKIFAETTLSVEQAMTALKALEDKDISAIVLMAAKIGSLQSTGWADEMQDIADAQLRQLERSDTYKKVLHPEVALTLLQYYQENAITTGIQGATQLTAEISAQSDDKTGLAAIQRAYKLLSHNKKTRVLAFTLLQKYVHIAPEKPAKHVTRYYSKELGSSAAERLDMSYRFSSFMARMDLETWAGALNITVELLQTSATAYARKDSAPSLKRLLAIADNMRLRLDEQQRKAFADALIRSGKLIVMAGKQHESYSHSDFKHLDAVLKGTADPHSIVDVFRAAGGHLSRGQQYHLRLKPTSTATPLGNAAPAELLVSLGVAGDILEGTLRALPVTEAVSWTNQQVTKEFDSLRRNLHGAHTRELLRQLAIDLQKIAELIVHIQSNGDNSVMDASSRTAKRIDSGTTEPASTLEMYRYLAVMLQK
ncbi:MAG: hypothetical protein ACPG7F_07790 [Aggregatilineales bacterium]